MSNVELDETTETYPEEREAMHLIKLTPRPPTPFTLTTAC